MIRLRGQWRKALIVAVLLIAVGFLCYGAIEVSVLSPEKEAEPGEFVTHVFAVLNSSEIPDLFTLEFVAPLNWALLDAPSTIALDPGEEGALFVTVAVPPGAPAGAHRLTLHATSVNDPTAQASASATTRVRPIRAVEIILPKNRGVVPGETISYQVIVINRGNAQDTFQFEARSARGFPITVSDPLLSLAPQERWPVTVTVTVPIHTSPGRDVLTFTTTSILHYGVRDEKIMFETILPPPPQAVAGTLLEELPTRLRLSIGQNLFTGELDSDLTFAVAGGVLGGYFSTHLRLSSLFGPDPLKLRTFALLYRHAPATFVIGDTSQRLTDLLSISGRGGRVEINTELYRLAFLGAGRAGETRAGARLSLGPVAANLGIAYFSNRTEAEDQAVWNLTAAGVPLEGWSLRMEGALGLENRMTSRAFFFATTIDTPGYFFHGEVFSVGTHFPGLRRDQAGIALSQRLRLADFSFGSSLNRRWNNVIGNPLVPTTISDDLGINLLATPLEGGPTIASTVEFTWRRDSALTRENRVNRLVSVTLSETTGVFPFSFSARLADRIDHVADTWFRTLTFSEGVGLSLDAFDLFLKLRHERRTDHLTGEVLSGDTDVSLRFRSRGTLNSATITFGKDKDDFDLSLSVNARIFDSLNLVLSGTFGWDRADATATTFRWGTTFDWRFALPIPFLVTRGRIAGRVFVDQDGDGVFSAGDQGLAGVIVIADQNEVSTDKHGVYRFPPLAPGEYTLDLRRLPIDVALPVPITVALEAGQTARVDFALTPIVVVSGILFNDVDKDGALNIGEGGFAQVRIVLTDPTGRMNNAHTDLHGRFTFIGVLPGSYTVTIDPNTLPDRFVFTTAESFTIEVIREAPPPIQFGGYIKPRPIVIMFKPPTADFIYTPEQPMAGEPVLFDGSYSFDFDGEVVSHEWDFDGDGEIDAVGITAQTIFPVAGLHDVTLTITDDTGHSDSITFTIDVRPGQVVITLHPPVANFVYTPEQPTVGELVLFDGSGSTDFDGEIVSHKWDFDGDGEIDAIGITAQTVFPVAGLHNVTLTVTDDTGHSDSITYTIDVRPGQDVITLHPPVANFVYTPERPTSGELVLFDSSGSTDFDGEVVSHEWDFDGDGEIDAVGITAQTIFPVAGLHDVTLTVTDDTEISDSITHTIVVE